MKNYKTMQEKIDRIMKKKQMKIMKKGVIILGKWHFKLGVIPIYWRQNGLMFEFGIFKLISLPLEGHIITKENYKGFWFRKEIEFRGIEISIIN